jgi:DNA-binding transcriptional regulator YdaS (Cro superfamily)
MKQAPRRLNCAWPAVACRAYGSHLIFAMFHQGRWEGMGRRKRVFDESQVLRMLRTAVRREGSQMAFAKRHGLNRSNLNLVLSGKRPISDSVARPLGLCRLYVAGEDQTLRMLRAAIEREGGQSAFARRHGLDRSNLNLVLSGKRRVTEAVARPLGLCGLYVAN